MGTVMARGFVLACLVAGVASATHAGTSNSAFMQEGAKDPNLLKGTIWDKTLVRDVTLATDMAPVSPLNTAEAMGRCEVCVYVIENKEGHQPYLCRGLRDPHYQQTCEAVMESMMWWLPTKCTGSATVASARRKARSSGSAPAPPTLSALGCRTCTTGSLTAPPIHTTSTPHKCESGYWNPNQCEKPWHLPSACNETQLWRSRASEANPDAFSPLMNDSSIQKKK